MDELSISVKQKQEALQCLKYQKKFDALSANGEFLENVSEFQNFYKIHNATDNSCEKDT